MTFAAFALIVLAACIHAGWNTLSKRSGGYLNLYMWAMGFGALIYSPLMLLNWQKIVHLPGEFWGLLAMSALCQSLYLFGLAKAYQSADLSMVYPLARALPVLMVPLFLLLSPRVSEFSMIDTLGVLLIALGAMAMPLTRWRNFKLRLYLQPAVGWAICAAVGTAGYSIIDNLALEVMDEQTLVGFNAGASYVVLQALSTAFTLMLVSALVFKTPLEWPVNVKVSVLTGVFLVGTYLLVLVSMTMVVDVSYVVALRQLSIPIGVAIGVFWLKEKVTVPRLQGLCLMLIGIIIVSLRF